MKPGSLKLPFLLCTAAILAGCASSGPPLPPSLEVAAPVTDLRALRKGDRIYLAWTVPSRTTDHQAIRYPGPTLICRSVEAAMTACGTPVGRIPPPALAPKTKSKNQSKKTPAAKTTAIYTDSLPFVAGVQPESQITYAVKALNDRDRSAGLSNQFRVPAMPAVPPPDAFQANLSAQGVEFSWTCFSPPQLPYVEYRLRIFRRLAGAPSGSQSDEKIAEPTITPAGSDACRIPAVLDTSFEWEKTYCYRAAVVTLISPPGQPALEIEGDDTPGVTVFAHDVFPPAVPSGLEAVFSGPGQAPFVDLIWSPDGDADLAGYNVYRREESGQPEKLNSTPVKPPAFRDDHVLSGKKYFYSVSAVDVRGNESAKSAETSESVP